MIADNATDIQIIVKVTQRFIVKKFMFCVSHGISSIKSLTPSQWVGNRHVTGVPTRYWERGDYAVNAGFQLDTLIIQHFSPKVNLFSHSLV